MGKGIGKWGRERTPHHTATRWGRGMGRGGGSKTPTPHQRVSKESCGVGLEAKGFEPLVQFILYVDLANQYLKPLGHTSTVFQC